MKTVLLVPMQNVGTSDKKYDVKVHLSDLVRFGFRKIVAGLKNLKALIGKNKLDAK